MRIPMALVLTCGLLAGCEWVTTAVNTSIDVGVMFAADRTVYNVMDDYSIKSEITSLFVDEALVLNISTDIYQGMVMLTGTVKDEKDKSKAEKLARQVRGVRELFNEIQVTTEGGVSATVKDLIMENKLKAKLVFAAGLSSINFRWRAVNSVIYFMGMAKSRDELDRVVTMARMDGVRKIVTHVFLTDQLVFDGAPIKPAEEQKADKDIVKTEKEMVKTEKDLVKTEKKVATVESEGAKNKTIADGNAAYERTFPRRGPPGVPPEMPTYYDRPIDQLY